MTVVRRRASQSFKALPHRLQRRQVALPRTYFFSALAGQRIEIGQEARMIGIDHGIWPKRWHHVPFPFRVTNGFVMFERIQRRVSRRQHLYVEPLIKSAREKLWRLELGGDCVEVKIRRSPCQGFTQAENLLKCLVQPDASRRAAKQMIMLGKSTPHFARIPSIPNTNLQFFERHTLAVQHPANIVIGLHHELRWVGERLIQREPLGFCMSVRAHNWQISHVVVQGTSNFACAPLTRNQPVWMNQHGSNYRSRSATREPNDSSGYTPLGARGWVPILALSVSQT